MEESEPVADSRGPGRPARVPRIPLILRDAMDKQVITLEMVEDLAKAMRESGQSAVIDWTNRRIDVLGPETDTIVRSAGRFLVYYRERLFTIRGMFR